MALRTVITERQRRLGAELRKLREAAGLSIAEASRSVGMGAPHLSHVEAGRTAAPPERIRELTQLYGCMNEPYVVELVGMSESSGKGWWSAYKGLLPQTTVDLAELEARATMLHSYESLFIPGLLQTEAYTRAIFRASDVVSPSEAAAAVRFRMERQEVLTREHPPEFHAVIHEAALHMRFGGREVMRHQLRHIIELAQLPHVTVQVLPFAADGIPAANTPFYCLTSHGGHLETVLLDHPAAGTLYLHQTEELARYRRQFERLHATSLPPVNATATPIDDTHDSLGLIQYVRYGL